MIKRVYAAINSPNQHLYPLIIDAPSLLDNVTILAEPPLLAEVRDTLAALNAGKPVFGTKFVVFASELHENHRKNFLEHLENFGSDY